MTVKITFAGSSRTTWSRPSIYENFLRLAHAESFPELIRGHHACRKLNKKKSFKRHADSFHPVLGWNISYRYSHTKTLTHTHTRTQSTNLECTKSNMPQAPLSELFNHCVILLVSSFAERPLLVPRTRRGMLRCGGKVLQIHAEIRHLPIFRLKVV